MSVRTEKLATRSPSKWGRQRAGGHKIKETETNNKQGRKGKHIQASLINSKVYGKTRKKRKRGSKKGEGKEMININHSKRRLYNY